MPTMHKCAQLKSLPVAPVIQRAKSQKCPGCQTILLPTGKCPRCKTKVEPKVEKLVGKEKKKEEKRRVKEEREQHKMEDARKEEIAALGSKKGAVSAWEADKANFLEQFVEDGAAVANPANTAPAKYPIKTLDIDIVAQTQPKLAKLLEDSLDLIQVRPNTPEHDNRERRFPVYDKATHPKAYWEFSYLGGGGRLVIDAIAGIIYISAHYSYNYKLVKGGAIPAAPVAAARETQRQIIALESAWEELEERHFQRLAGFGPERFRDWRQSDQYRWYEDEALTFGRGNPLPPDRSELLEARIRRGE